MKTADKKIVETERELRKVLKEIKNFETEFGTPGVCELAELLEYTRKIRKDIKLTEKEAKRYELLMHYTDLNRKKSSLENRMEKLKNKTSDNMTDEEKREYYLKAMKAAADKKKKEAELQNQQKEE